MTPARHDIRIDRGLPWRLTLTLYQDKAGETPVDVTGWSFALEIEMEDGTTASATVTITDAAAGEIQADLSAAQTTALADGKADWDLVGRDAAGFDHLPAEGTASIRTPKSSI